MFDHLLQGGGGGGEDAGVPGDDLGDAAGALEGGELAVCGSVYFDAFAAHVAAPGDAPAVGEADGCAACHDLVAEFLGG